MSETEGLTKPPAISKKSPWMKLFDGDYGLATTFWLHVVLISLVLKVGLVFAAMSSRSLVLALLAPYLVYRLVALAGTWHAADKYSGNTAWAASAKVVVAICLLEIASSVATIVQ